MMTPVPTLTFATPRAGRADPRGSALGVAVTAAVFISCLLVVGRSAGVWALLYAAASMIALAAIASRRARAAYSAGAGRSRAEGDLRRALEAQVAARTAELSRVNETLKAEADECRRVDAERVRLLRRLVTAQEEERQRISRELHDQLGQYLSTMMLRLKTLEPLADGRGEARAGLRQLEELTVRLADEVHHLAWELRPAALDDLCLHTVLQNYTERWSERGGVVADFHCGGLERHRLSPEVETTVYRVVQESLTNVLKHAGARRVSVIVERRRDQLLVIVEDDGSGFEVEEVSVAARPGRGLGLLGMRERVALVGGSFSLEASPGGGTTVRARIPIPPAAEKEVFPREYFAHPVGR